MPYQVKASEAVEFGEAVQKHIAALTAHTKEKRNTPRPTAPIEVEMAVKRVQFPIEDKKPDAFEPDYTVIEDPLPAPLNLTLEDKKIMLQSKLGMAEEEAKRAVLPPRKMRLLTLAATEAFQKPEDQRSTSEVAIIDTWNTVNAKWRKISLIAAKAESDIEDLTEGNILTWEVPVFA